MAKAQAGGKGGQQQSAKAAAKKRIVKVDAYGDAHVNATFNNLIISITNKQGQVISWSSAGKMGFKGSKKNTPYAAGQAAGDCGKVAYDLGLRKVEVFVKGSVDVCFAYRLDNNYTLFGNFFALSHFFDNYYELLGLMHNPGPVSTFYVFLEKAQYHYSAISQSLIYYLVAFFLLATVLRLPLRVRELFLVR